mmetsp:Transcript_1902/g.4925  ORF Transcript_1902/g.4925 Transcript_1902/m.4925 type:complete len:200 (+) Transcript_1902:907-1506(+)
MPRQRAAARQSRRDWLHGQGRNQLQRRGAPAGQVQVLEYRLHEPSGPQLQLGGRRRGCSQPLHLRHLRLQHGRRIGQCVHGSRPEHRQVQEHVCRGASAEWWKRGGHRQGGLHRLLCCDGGLHNGPGVLRLWHHPYESGRDHRDGPRRPDLRQQRRGFVVHFHHRGVHGPNRPQLQRSCDAEREHVVRGEGGGLHDAYR